MTMRTLVAAAVAAALASSSAIAQTRPGAETAPGTPAPQTAPAPQPAQTPPPTPGPTFRSGVDLITIDVGVVDGRGRPVDDLGAAEFSVKIDGEVRRVVSAELVKVDVEAAKKQVADKSETFYTSNLTPSNGRQIVIAVDQMHIRPGSIRPIMAAASRFLDRLSPLDQVAFIVFPEPGPRVNFTSDKLKLRLAMQGLIGQQPRAIVGQHNIGVTEALAISEPSRSADARPGGHPRVPRLGTVAARTVRARHRHRGRRDRAAVARGDRRVGGRSARRFCASSRRSTGTSR